MQQTPFELQDEMTSLNIKSETETEASLQQENYTNELNENVDYGNWQQTQWHNYLPSTPDSFIWTPTLPPPTPLNYALKPMIASAPVTPDVIPYHGKSLVSCQKL